MSYRILVLVCSLMCAVGVSVAVARHGDDDARSVGAAPAAVRSDEPVATDELADRTRVVAAGRVLGGWDDRRAAAYASNDRRALRRLYAPGSAAGAADLRVLGSYAARRLTVEGMRMQVIDLRVLRGEDGLLVVRVQDRLARAAVVSPSGRAGLPIDRPSTRIVRLVKRDGRWLVSSVRTAEAV